MKCPGVQDLAAELIRKPSVTPDDAGCQALIADILGGMGFECHHLRFGEGEPNGPVDNLWAIRKGTSPDARLFCFAGHTDVVPVGNENEWQHPAFAATTENGMLVGRGAADMKGSLAAMLNAVANYLEQNPEPKHSIAFLITSDEEGPAEFGTVKVVEYLQRESTHIDWCLVGEPSSTDKVGDVIKNGRRGSLNGTLTIQGIQGHVAYPDLAENPVHSGLGALQQLCEKTWDEGDEFFPPTSFQISNIQAGTGATNVIPGTVTVTFNFRFSTRWAAEALQQECHRLLDDHGLKYQLDWSLSGNPFITEKGELVDATVAAIKTVTNTDAQLLTSGGTSDGRFIAPTGSQVVELGPVNSTIHKVDECTNLDELEQLSDIYGEILQKLVS
jgi:succinyl-diaminopimelate desuccinylase